jgi:hypothetical protein
MVLTEKVIMIKVVLFGSYGFVPEEGDKKRIKLLELAYKKKVHRLYFV